MYIYRGAIPKLGATLGLSQNVDFGGFRLYIQGLA